MIRKIIWTFLGLLAGIVAGKGVYNQFEFILYVFFGAAIGFGLATFLEKRKQQNSLDKK